MKLANVEQTVQMPAVSFYSEKIENIEFIQKLNAYYAAAAENPSASLGALETELEEICPKDLKENLAKDSLKPYSHIDITTNLGHVIFDIFMTHTEVPMSPLKKKVLEKQVQELAAMLNKSEFEIDDTIQALLRKVLNDDELWTKTAFSVETSTNKHMQVNYRGIEAFHKIIEKLVEAFLKD